MAGGYVAAQRRHGPGMSLAEGLGWFSIALGVLELAAPRAVTRPLGLRGHEGLARAYGLREIGTGIGILTSNDPAPWIWGRVAGDVLDVGTVLGGLGRRPGNVLTTLLLLAGVGALDVMCAQELAANRRGGAAEGNPEVERAITVNAPAEELQRRWRDPDTLRQVAAFLADVHPAADGQTRWEAPGPLGQRLEGAVETVADRPGEVIAWRSLPGADVPNEGSVTFSPATGGRGTVVTLRLRFDPPGGALGAAAMRMLGGLLPAAAADKALHRFKALVETGEIPTTAHQPAARADTR